MTAQSANADLPATVGPAACVRCPLTVTSIGTRYVGADEPSRGRREIAATFAGTVVSVPVEVGAHRATRTAGARDRVDEDGARRRRGARRPGHGHCNRGRRDRRHRRAARRARARRAGHRDCRVGGNTRSRPATAPRRPRRGARPPRGRARRPRGPTPSAAPAGTGQRTARENVADLCDDGTLRGVRRAGHRRAATAPRGRGAHRAHAGRRPRRRHRPTSNGQLDDESVASCLRLHRARRHAGPAEPPQEGPAVRAGRAAAAAGRAVRRGRRRAAGRHRHAGRRPASTAWRSRLFARPQRAGAAGRHRVGALLRRQRRAARLLRRRHRHRGRQHRHGRPGDDRGRRARRVRARGRSARSTVQVPNGVVDVAVADEAEAVAVAKQYLSYFQGPVDDWDVRRPARCCATSIPENRLRVYDVRAVIDGLADTGSVLELRAAFGVGMVTALARIEGRPVGIVANNPAPPRRRHRRRRRRQGGALPPAVRRVRPAGAVPVRHAGVHGRAGGREDRAGAPRQPACS